MLRLISRCTLARHRCTRGWTRLGFWAWKRVPSAVLTPSELPSACVEARPGGPHRKRIRHRRDASLRIAQEPRLSEIHARHVGRRRAVSELVRREVRGTQHVVVHAVAGLQHGPLVDRPGAGHARHPHRLSAPAHGPSGPDRRRRRFRRARRRRSVQVAESDSWHTPPRPVARSRRPRSGRSR